MSEVADPAEPDRLDARLALGAGGLLRTFNQAGVIAAADVHVATTLGRLCGEADDAVLLAAALAVRAPRVSHVCTDLAGARSTVTVDADFPVDIESLPWPEIGPWLAAVAASPMVCLGADGAADRPLRLVGTLLYLDRYAREEGQVGADLLDRSRAPHRQVNMEVLAQGLERLFPADATDPQRLAAATAVLRHLTVLAGGPGTGKTTTVARILALIHAQAAALGGPVPRMALAAPTGKAAARLEEAVHHEARSIDVPDEVRTRLLETEASTLHRLLGWRPGSRSRFAHSRANRLPHDVVVVDESSMVSLSMMARLVEAVRPAARLVLVGDPEQLASVEAGAVLGDVVGPAAEGLVLSRAARATLTAVAGADVPATAAPAGVTTGDGIVVLQRVHRFAAASGIAALARAIKAGDEEAAAEVLGTQRCDLTWVGTDAAADSGRNGSPVREAAVDVGRRVITAARGGDGGAALEAMASLRLLCAHRRGPHGVAHWRAQMEAWLADDVEGFAARTEWYPGRPLLVTENDYGLRLYNGDTGVIVSRGDDRVTAVFERRGELVEVSPTLLSSVETVYAMTVHKSQGSQFDSVVVLLPPPESPLLTRELLYTAVTRARSHLTIVGTDASVRAAVNRPIARSSGLRAALWGPAARET